MKKLFFRIFRKKIDEYRDFSIQKKISVAFVLLLVPLILFVLIWFVCALDATNRYDKVVRNTSIISEFNLDFKKNYEDMIHLLQEKGVAVTAVIAPPIAIEVYLSHLLKSGVGKDIMSEYVNSVQQMEDEFAEYGEIMRTVAKVNNCEILSLRESFLALNDIKEYYSKDGMHPNEAGYAIIRDDFTKYFSSCAR